VRGASIVLKGKEKFEKRTARRQSWKMSRVAAVIDVKTEEDVQETVCLHFSFIAIARRSHLWFLIFYSDLYPKKLSSQTPSHSIP
jgi:hypothetical protein